MHYIAFTLFSYDLKFVKKEIFAKRSTKIHTFSVISNYVTAFNTPISKSLERAWSRGIVDRTKEYSFVLSTMPRLHARSRLLE